MKIPKGPSAPPELMMENKVKTLALCKDCTYCMDPKLIKAHNQTAFLKSLVFYSPIKIYTRENGLHFVHLPDYSSLKLFIYFHVEKIGKHMSFHWFQPSEKMHTEVQTSIDSQKSARLQGEWETEKSGEKSCLVLQLAWNLTVLIINLSLVSVTTFSACITVSLTAHARTCYCSLVTPLHGYLAAVFTDVDWT